MLACESTMAVVAWVCVVAHLSSGYYTSRMVSLLRVTLVMSAVGVATATVLAFALVVHSVVRENHRTRVAVLSFEGFCPGRPSPFKVLRRRVSWQWK